MFTLAHLSDVHLSPLPRPRGLELMNKRVLGYLNWYRRQNNHRRDILNALVDDLRKQEIDHIAVTGDLTNLSLPTEFALAREWLDALGAPDGVTVIPGNHDAYTPLLRDPGFGRWQPYMCANEAGTRFMNGAGEVFPFLRLFGGIALIGLCTARPTMPGMASGRVGAAQLRVLEVMLSRLGAEGYCRVVLIHHPPLPGMARWERALHDARRMRDVLTRHGAELVIYGHNHRFKMTALETPKGPIPIIGASSASLAAQHPEKMARYILYRIAKRSDGRWEIGLKSRVIDHAGAVVGIDHSLLG